MKHFPLVAALFCSLQGFSQFFPATSYPRDYFRDPLDVPISLAANFGELRPNHYHMGLDIRTQHRENLAVYAAADGYVARISIEPGGFGQAIYINHPNGYTTVYGHLNKFFPALAAWVHQEQYRRQSWQIYLEIPPSLFPVKKGDLIAYSGSTGGSQGPHLHFEIRRTAGDINLNPLLFGLPVPDHTAPGIAKLAWYDRDLGIYDQSPHLVPAHLEAPRGARGPASPAYKAYTITPSLLVVHTTRISFALSAFDTQTGSANPNGIFEADLFEDDQPVIAFRMDRISYDNTRNINAHIDYKTRERGGPFLQQLFFLSGYPFPSIYAVPASKGFPSGEASDPAAHPSGAHPADGVLDISDGRPHKIVIKVLDTENNSSSLVFEVQYKPATMPADAAPTPDSTAAVPGKKFYVGMVDGVEIPGCAFYLGEKSLYDSMTIDATVSGYPGSGHSIPGGVSSTYAIGAPWLPLLEPMLVRLKNEQTWRTDSLSGSDWTAAERKIVMVCFNGDQKDVERPEWHEGWASARFRGFGNFELVDDTIPPTITPLGPLEGATLDKAPRIAFSIKDNLGTLHNFKAELDGAWLCFTNDKGLAFIYTFDEHCQPGPHTLKVSVEDVAGNKTVREYHFTR
jgi:murein DD-endopeptidase MepM/ murein hydrolase activator NlpD